MAKRTTIEIDEDLLQRAKRALGRKSTRATVEEAVRQAADAAERDQSERAARQLGYLDRLKNYVDLEVLASDEMWR
jgi:Arc/MetJ family transcription regulator